MSKQHVHFAAYGYQPMRMKPVHFANGFFLSLIKKYYDLELANKASVIKTKKGLKNGYESGNLLTLLRELGKVDRTFNETDLNLLRIQLNGLLDNDDGVNPVYDSYSSFGNDYTLVSKNFITSQRRLDGYAGHLLHSVLECSGKGRNIIEFASNCIKQTNTSMESLFRPLLDDDDSFSEWENPYSINYGDLTEERLLIISNLMMEQTIAISRLCDYLRYNAPQHTCLRSLIIALCSWLFLYIHKYPKEENFKPIFLMDYLGGKNERIRNSSRNCYNRFRQSFFASYDELWRRGMLECDEADFLDFNNNPKILEQHYTDLAIRIGFAQPRASQVRNKHYELQPDTLRTLFLSVISENQIEQINVVANKLREVWGVCFGGCDDDFTVLRQNGFITIDIDADLELNRLAFIDVLKKLGLAAEPSDGLVLCASKEEELL